MSLDSIIIYLAVITLPPSKLMAQSHKPIQRGPEKYDSRRNGSNSLWEKPRIYNCLNRQWLFDCFN